MGAIAASGLALVSGCSDTFDPSSDSEGRILLNLDLNREVAAPKQSAKSRAGQAKEITATDLKLTLKADDGSMERSWASLTDFDNSEDFPVGMYTMEASYGSEAEEGFDKPYYFGSTALRIRENETTPANITARLGNAMVTVVYTEAVRNYFSACKGEVVSVSGTPHDYTLDETRALYVQPGHVEINAVFTKQNGVSGKVNAAGFEAEARHHYVVTVDANGGEVGNGVLVITFNSDLVEEEIEIDLSDDILTAPAPAITASGFTPGEALEVVEGTASAEPLRMTVMAQGVVNTAVLTVHSASLREQGWPETVDFASADAATLGKLRGLGLDFFGLEGVKSKMAVVDFTKVLSHITYVEGGDNTTTFTLVAKDAYSKVSEPLTLSVAVEKLALAIENVDNLFMDETELSFDMSFNGTDANNVRFKIKNARGTFDDAVVKSIAPVSRASSVYHVVLEVPADDKDVVVYAVCGNVTSETITVKRGEPNHVLAVADNDVFATHASGSLSLVDGGDAAAALASASLLLSEDGVAFTEVAKNASGGGFSLSGLKPAQTYYLKAKLNAQMSRVVTFTTEAATQLPNGGMEEWPATTKISDYCDKYDVAGWDTMNGLTTSQKGAGYAYICNSGTIPTTDAQSGSKAALIRTVGWGSGNTASANLFNKKSFGTCKHITAGELFLGTFGGTDAPNNYGITFSSRPTSLSFYYKYATAYDNDNGDYGTAYVCVSDASGNVISEKSQQLSKKSAYGLVTLPLEYSDDCPKAAKISVIFKSSGNSECLKANATYMSPPPPMNLSDGEYLGSQLYVDDIVLNY